MFVCVKERERERVGGNDWDYRIKNLESESECGGFLMFVRAAGVHKKLTGSFAVLWTQICGKFFPPHFFS